MQRWPVRLRDQPRLTTTIGYGPRFLHSTGQLHNVGANNALFTQIAVDLLREFWSRLFGGGWPRQRHKKTRLEGEEPGARVTRAENYVSNAARRPHHHRDGVLTTSPPSLRRVPDRSVTQGSRLFHTQANKRVVAVVVA